MEAGDQGHAMQSGWCARHRIPQVPMRSSESTAPVPSPSIQAPLTRESRGREDLADLGEQADPVVSGVAVREMEQDQLPRPDRGGQPAHLRAGEMPMPPGQLGVVVAVAGLTDNRERGQIRKGDKLGGVTNQERGQIRNRDKSGSRT